MPKRGFTLIELMVVIAIIAILASVGVTAYRSANKSARVSKRLQDLRAIKNALITYKTANGSYPIVTTSTCADLALSSGTLNPTPFVPSYMNVVPKDPSNTCYFYVSDSTGSTYKVTTDSTLSSSDMSASVISSQPSFIDPSNSLQWAVYSGSGGSLTAGISTCSSGITCSGSCTATCAASGTQTGCIYTQPSPCTQVSAPDQSCPQTTCNANQTCVSGVCKNSLDVGLLSYWKMDEGSGTSVADSVGTNNGTASTNTTIVPGLLGNARNYTASNSNVSVPDNPSLRGLSAGSLSVWLKPSSYINTIPIGYYPFYYIYLFGQTLYVFLGGTYVMNALPFTLNLGSWNNIVFTWDGTAAKAYINGSLLTSTLATQTASGTNLGYPLCIGNYNAGNCNNSYSPLVPMDEVGIWNRALSASEVSSLYNGGTGVTLP